MAHRPLAFGIALLALAGAAPPAGAADASFTLVNRGQIPVREVFVTPAGDANWGRNRLERGALPPGGKFEVLRRRDGNCIMDIRVLFADGRREERRGLNTCALDAVAVGEPATGGAAAGGAAAGKPADDASFRLVNRGRQAIVELFAAPAGSGAWGDNRLDASGLPAAAEKLVRIDGRGQCVFDLRVVFADHKALEKRRANLCRITDLPVP